MLLSTTIIRLVSVSLPRLAAAGPGADQAAAQAAAERAEVILVIGTSGIVYPAAALATSYNPSAFVVEINPGESALSARCSLAIREGAATALPSLVERLQGARRIGGP